MSKTDLLKQTSRHPTALVIMVLFGALLVLPLALPLSADFDPGGGLGLPNRPQGVAATATPRAGDVATRVAQTLEARATAAVAAMTADTSAIETAVAASEAATAAEAGAVETALAAIVRAALGASVAAEQGFDRPEDAIAYFFDRVAAEDYDAALSACAINTKSERYDFEAMAERLKSIHPEVMLPSEYAMFAQFNEAKHKADVLRQLVWMSLSVTLPDEYADFLKGYPLLGEHVDYGDFVKSVDPAPFKGIVIVDIGEHHLLETDRHQKTLMRQAEVYGAKAATSRDVLYRIDGNYYAGGVMLLEYDSGWLIDSLMDPLINQPAFGSLIPVGNESEFIDLLEGKSR